jgi:ABC-type uncharacterized transport system involved in gliding motility auxiliary subunit
VTSFRRRIFIALAGVAILVALDVAVHRLRRQIDLTSESSQTLTDETRAVVSKVRTRVNATVFFAREDGARVTAASLLLRYRRLNGNIDFRLLDPAQAPAEATRLKIDPIFGGIAVEQGGAVEIAKTPTEQDVTAALARLQRGKPSNVCLTRGHGESDPDSTLDDGFKFAVDILERNGYRPRGVDLLTRPEIPADCDALIIANPVTPLGAAADALAAYLKDGGRAVLLLDPISTVDVEPLIQPFGMRIERGIVLEGDPQLRFPDDPTRPVIPFYRSANPIVNRLPPTFFPGAQAIIATDEKIGGLTFSELAQTSENSYLEREPLNPSFDERSDIRGPITVAAAIDKSANIGGEVLRTRIAVFGDSDFASNAYVGEAGNSTFFIRSLDWAVLEEDLVSVSANLPKLRPLELTEGRIAYARILLAGVIPGVFLLFGGAVWAVRRGR